MVGAFSGFTGYAVWDVLPSAFRVYGVRLRGGIGMYKDFFVRFPGLRGTHVGWYFM